MIMNEAVCFVVTVGMAEIKEFWSCSVVISAYIGSVVELSDIV